MNRLQTSLGHNGTSFSQQHDMGSGCLISLHSWGTEAQRGEGTLPQSGVSSRELGEGRGSGVRRTEALGLSCCVTSNLRASVSS